MKNIKQLEIAAMKSTELGEKIRRKNSFPPPRRKSKKFKATCIGNRSNFCKTKSTKQKISLHFTLLYLFFIYDISVADHQQTNLNESSTISRNSSINTVTLPNNGTNDEGKKEIYVNFISTFTLSKNFPIFLICWNLF